MTKQSVLAEAEAIINGQRRQDYGEALPSFDRIAKLWAPVLGCDVTAEQVALCMIGLKIARTMNGFDRDSIVDIAGYAGCLEKIADERQTVKGQTTCDVCGCHGDCLGGCALNRVRDIGDARDITLRCTRCSESVP